MHLISLLAQYYYNCYYILCVTFYITSCYHVSDFEVFHFLLLLSFFFVFPSFNLMCTFVLIFKLHASVHLCVFSLYGLIFIGADFYFTCNIMMEGTDEQRGERARELELCNLYALFSFFSRYFVSFVFNPTKKVWSKIVITLLALIS